VRETTDPLVGATVAHYVVEARLGGGGMGVVYAARDTKLGRRVALKFLPPQWSHDESAKQRFIREAQAASATDHPHICTIHDILEAADGQLFIVMAHYDGETLKARLERGRLDVDEAVDIAAQVAEGLTKAHAHGVIHRDVKPGNLMLTEHGVRILDFGLAKFADARLKLTLEGSTIGTIAYMSPEQARGDEADARSDVWAVGVVLYEMLTGETPFKGGYPEAISHAIRNEPPAPIRAAVPDVPETLEHLVFRTLHKDPAVRLPSARDLARALRLLQGRTLPVDLRTEPLPRVERGHGTGTRLRWLRTRRGVAGALVGTVVLAGVLLWLLAPVDRVPVVVAPVVNQTGYAELDPYRLALTQELIAQLSASRRLRLVPYDRLLQIIRRYRQGPADVSSREAMQAVATQSGAAMVIVPTLLNDNGALRARIDLRDVVTAASVATYETGPVVSSLVKDSAYGLMLPVAAAVNDHTRRTGSWRAYAGDAIRSLASPRPPPRSQLRTLDAAAAFERGVDAYAQQEYAAALGAFADAAQLDPRNALPLAWKSRAARMMRQDDTMAEAASAAGALLSTGDETSDRPLVEAMVAEGRRDLELAADRYSAYVDAAPDEPGRALELAGFNERSGRGAEAIAAHHRALALDERLARPHLDLCRLYNPNELANAREHGQRALAAFRQLGTRAEEAHALWCLVDILRLGDAAQVAQAREFAEAALAIFRTAGYPYNLARALNYVALAASAQGRVAEAATLWAQSLAAAREVGNAQLQPLALMNLGFMHVRLGQRAQAVDFYQQGARGFESLGQEQRAAELRANAANIRIENGDDPDQGMRDAQNALLVSRKLGLPQFEVLATQLIAAYYRNGGRHAEAARELNRALSLAKERDLRDDIGSLTTDLARSRLDQGDYDGARRLLEDAVGMSAGVGQTHSRIRLGEAYLAAGDLERARAALAQADDDLKKGAEPQLMAPLAAAGGKAAFESGDLTEARRQFARAAALWTDNLPEAESVEALAYLGLIDGLSGQPERGRQQIVRSLEQARKMGRVSLETRCGVFLARLQLANRNPGEAARTLADLPPDSDTVTHGRELRAQVYYWSAQAKTALGDLHGAAMDHAAARQLIMELQTGLSAGDRPRLAARPDIQRIIG